VIFGLIIGVLLMPSGCIGEIEADYKEFTPYLQAKTLPSGHIEPLYIEMLQTQGFVFRYQHTQMLNALLVPIVSLCLFFCLPFFVAQTVAYCHLLLVRHPVEAEVTSALKEDRPIQPEEVEDSTYTYDPNDENVPPAWISRNLTRRLEALTKRVRRESTLKQELIDRERRRAHDE